MAKQFLDKAGVQVFWNKVKSSFSKIGYLGSNANFNNVTDGGMYRYDTNPSNAPSGGGTHGQLLVVRGTGDTIAQLCFPYSTSRVYLRTGNPVGNSSGVWNEWVELANTNNLTWDNIQNKPSSFTPSSHTHTKSQITDFPTIPTVNNPTITITQGGVSKGSFTLNQSGAKTIALEGGNVVELTRVWSGNSTTASFSVDYNSVYFVVFDYMTTIIKTAESGLGSIGYSNFISFIDSNSTIVGRGLYYTQIYAYKTGIESNFKLVSKMTSSGITNSTSSTETYHYIKEVYKITM